MKFNKSLFLFLMLTPGITIAEVGDIHTVKVDNATVRDGPGDDMPEVEKLGKGTEIMEMSVQGDWFEIYVADTDLSGWMNASTLQLLGGADAETAAAEAAATPATAAEPKVAPVTGRPVPPPSAAAKIAVKGSGSKSDALKEFDKYLVRYNTRTNVLKGYIPLTAAEDVGDGELHLFVTNNWLEKTKARQKTSLITLYSRWKRANPSLSSVKVIAHDQSGNPVVQYPK